MNFECEIKHNIIYLRNRQDPDTSYEMVAICKVHFVGKVLKTIARPADENNKHPLFIYAFILGLPHGNITIPSNIFTNELDPGVQESIQSLRQLRQKIAEAYENYYNGIIISKPKEFKYEADT